MNVIKPKKVHLCTSFLLIFFLFFSTGFVLHAQDECIITGETEICSPGDQGFTFELEYDLLPGHTTLWIINDNFGGGSIIDQSNNSVTTSLSFGNNTIQAKVVDPDKNTIAVCFLNVVVVYSPLLNIQGSRSVCLGAIGEYQNNFNCPSCTYSWTASGLNVNISDPSSANTMVEFLTLGTGQLCLTRVDNVSGCTNSSCIDVEVYNLPEPSFQIVEAEDDNGSLSVCANQDIFFNNTSTSFDESVFEWNISNGTDSWSFFSEDLTFSFPSSGTYNINLTRSINGVENCESTTNIDISVQQLPPVEISCPSVVCQGEIVTYSVDVDCGSYNWEVSAQGIIINDNGNSIDVEWSNVDGYEIGYIIFEGDGCSGNYCTAPTIQSIPIFPTLAHITGDHVKCDNFNETFSFPIFPGAEYEWSHEIISTSTPDGSVNVINSSQPHRYSLSFTEFSGVVRIHGFVKHPVTGCQVEATHDIEVLNNRITGPDQICLGEAITLDLAPPYGNTVGWIVSFNGSVVFENNANASLTIPASALLSPGVYNVEATLTANNGETCVDDYDFEVIEAELPICFDGPLEICLGTEYSYSLECSDLGIIHWEMEQNGIVETLTGNAILFTWTEETGPYSITVSRELTHPISCFSNSMTYEVSVIENDQLVIEGNQVPCPDGQDAYNASLGGATNFEWTIPSGQGSVIEGSGTDEILVQWLYVEEETIVDIVLNALVCGNPVTANYPVVLTPYDLQISLSDVCVSEHVTFTSNITSAQSIQWFVDNNPVPAPAGANANLEFVFDEPGYHSIRLEVIDPNGCPGSFGELGEIMVNDNPVPYINSIAALPCPEGTPFTRTLQVTPNSNDYVYTWIRDNQVINGATSSTLDVDENDVGVNFYVQIQNGDCVNISTAFNFNYNCTPNGECPCTPDPGFDLGLSVDYSSDCGFLDVIGSIIEFENAYNPYWEIEKPGSEEENITIYEESDLSMLNYSIDRAGIYNFTLRTQYACEEKVPDYCPLNETAQIIVPFLSNYISTYECVQGATNSYNIILDDMSSYFENQSTVDFVWTESYSNSTGDATTFSIPNVPPGTSVDVCLNLISGTYDYNCEVCKTIVTPADPQTSFMYSQMGLCTDQIISFVPEFPEDEILELEWDFGDGSKSRLYEVSKVYMTAGVYDVTLTLTTIHGCDVTLSEPITILENTLDGDIIQTMMDCSASAELTFVQSAGMPVTQYLWTPTQETSSSIYVMESNVYGLEVTDANGCKHSPPSRTVVLKDPFGNGLSGDTESCGSIYMYLSNSIEYSYEWSISPDPTQVSPVSGNFISVSNLPEGTYTVSVDALGNNSTVCATLTEEITVFGAPSNPNIQLETNTCDPNTYTLYASFYDALFWTGPGIPVGYYGPSITVSEPGLYRGTYIDENGCSESSQKWVNDIIDFSNTLTGCYEYCAENILLNPPSLPGIPGSFDTWEWRLYDDNDNFVSVLSSGSGPVTDLTLLEDMSGQIRLYVDNGDCQEESGSFNVSIQDCPDIDCNGFDIEVLCQTCGCGNQYGGAVVYDSNGNELDPEIFDVYWEVDGVSFGGSYNPLSLNYVGTRIFTAYISYTSADGSIECNEVVSIETFCAGDCANYSVATCADISGSYDECEGSDGTGLCSPWGAGEYVFVVDGAGHPVDDMGFDWHVDMMTDPNPYFLYPTQNCEPTPVRVWTWYGCDTIIEYVPDCCSVMAPEVMCASNELDNRLITWAPVCGTQHYEIEFMCLSGWQDWFEPVIIVEPAEDGNFYYEVPFFQGCDLILGRVRGFCSKTKEYGEWSDCFGIEDNGGGQEGGCFTFGGEFCKEFFGEVGGDGEGGKGKSAELIALKSKGLLYPNPTNGDEVFLKFGQTLKDEFENVQIRIVDVNGKEINQVQTSTEIEIIKMNVSNLTSGIYFFGIYSDKGELITSERLMKTE